MAAVVVEATTPHAAALKYKTRNRNINDGASCGRNEDGISSSSHSLESGPRSPRSLISEVEQDGCNISWGRTLDSLRPTNHSKYISKPLKTQHHFSTIQYEVTTETTMDSNKDTGPSVNDSKLSTLVVNCDSWYGTVAIGQEVSEPGFSLSPETRSKTTLKYLEVPITPPLSKKKNSSKGRSPKKQHRKQSRKFTGDMTPPNSPVLLWGDYGSTHNSASLQKRNETLDDPDSPGRTPRRRLKAKFRLDNALLGEVEQATWEELLVSTHAEESPQTDSFSRLILEIASYNHSSVGKKRLSDANPLVTCAGGSFLGRFHATYSKRKEQDDGSEQGLESVSRMLFDDDDSFQSVSSDIIDMGGEVEEQKSKCRLLRFADEQGLPIAKIKVVGDENDPYASSRIIVLFLDPVAKKFEFMQGHFSHKARPTVSDLLLQLPGFATEEKFREQEFVSMYGTSDGPRQLAPKDPLHELNLGKREVAVAVMKGASGERLVKDAAPLLTNKTIMRAVRKASRIGRGLKYIKSMDEMVQEASEAATEATDVATPPVLDNNCTSDEGFEQDDLTKYPKKKPYPAPVVRIYENTQDQEVPNLDNFEDFHDAKWHDDGRESEEEPRRVMKYLHAAIWATIGIANTITNSS